VTRPDLPTFDLVVATVERVAELDRLLASLERQTHRAFRVLLVDQNSDDRLDKVLGAHTALDIVRLRSEQGLAHARNRAFPELRADLVAFPDDDCVYSDDLLERVASRLAAEPSLDGLSGRVVTAAGGASRSWKKDSAILTDDNLWNRAASGAIFLRRDLLASIGAFDERLGLGSGNPWASGEEIDLLIRATRSGARIAYDPELTVIHDDTALDPAALRALGFRDGASVGYVLRMHGYSARVVARMLARPLGGAAVSLLRGDIARARFHMATLRGRIDAYRRVR
jgi:GT2 family glycosyltransferase